MEHNAEPEFDQNDHRSQSPPTDSQERLLLALEAAGMGVFEWDVKSDALIWSRTTGLGLTPEQAPASSAAFLDLVHPDDRDTIRDIRTRVIHERQDPVTEFRVVLPNGAVHWIQAHGRVVCDDEGRPLRVIGVNTDITGRKSVEARFRDAQLQLTRLNVLRATMRTVQDIVSNALTSLQFMRIEAEPCISRQSLNLFDQIVEDTAAKLKALGDLQDVVQTEMAIGQGIDYPRGPGPKS
jgi:PAS domain S-box-containing protein